MYRPINIIPLEEYLGQAQVGRASCCQGSIVTPLVPNSDGLSILLSSLVKVTLLPMNISQVARSYQSHVKIPA